MNIQDVIKKTINSNNGIENMSENDILENLKNAGMD